MDGWSHPQIISMLEGGNDQLSGFFVRHSLSPKSAAVAVGSTTSTAAGGGNGTSSGDEDSDVVVAKAAAAAAQAAAALQANQKPKAPSRSSSFNTVNDIVALRYKTKAALFYRENLAKHVERVAADGRYKGREAARKRATGGGNSSSSSSTFLHNRALGSYNNFFSLNNFFRHFCINRSCFVNKNLNFFYFYSSKTNIGKYNCILTWV